MNVSFPHPCANTTGGCGHRPKSEGKKPSTKAILFLLDSHPELKTNIYWMRLAHLFLLSMYFVNRYEYP